MEQQAENLLRHLEAEGREIAKCRKLLSNLVLSSEKIECSQMLLICNDLNTHISSFDKINEQLIELENVCEADYTHEQNSLPIGSFR